MVADPSYNRNAAFGLALERAGLTRKAWAASIGVHANHVYLVVTGRRESARMRERIDQFVRATLTRNEIRRATHPSDAPQTHRTDSPESCSTYAAPATPAAA